MRPMRKGLRLQVRGMLRSTGAWDCRKIDFRKSRLPGLRSITAGEIEASRYRPVSRVGGRAVENERSAPALSARTSQREAGKHASLCEAMRSSRSVIYTPEALHFLEAPHIWLASNRTTFSVCAVCMAAQKVAAFAQPSVLSPASLHGCAKRADSFF